MSSSSRSAEGHPAVDARLVAPESGYEIIDGKAVEVPGADEPHGTRHSKVAALLEASVAEDYDVAVDMLTRTSKTNDFAPDASVFPRARDPRTGGRQLEELAFEIVSTQSLSDAGEKAGKLAGRGIRRIFAIDIPHQRVFEWTVETDGWQVLPDAGVVEDTCLAVPLPVEALVRAARADDAVAHALLTKRNPVLLAAVEEGREEGLRVGREQGLRVGREQGELARARRALAVLTDARELRLTPEHRARIENCTDLALLEHWLARAGTADKAADVFGSEPPA